MCIRDRSLISQINPSAVIRSTEERTRPKNSEVERLFGSNEKLKALTNWSPKWDLQAGLKDTIEWFRDPKNLAGYKTDIYNY